MLLRSKHPILVDPVVLQKPEEAWYCAQRAQYAGTAFGQQAVLPEDGLWPYSIPSPGVP